MAKYAYLFEVKSIQSYLFASGKLRDAVNGSLLIDQLLQQPLDNTLKVVGGEFIATRRAGGALYGYFEDATSRARFAALWPLYVQQLLPGIEMVAVCHDGANVQQAISGGLMALAAARNQQQVHLPLATPFSLRAPRTGAIAVCKRKDEHIDESMAALEKHSGANNTLCDKFYAAHGRSWPRDLAPSEFLYGSSKQLALIHADGNGLGKVLHHLGTVAKSLGDKEYCTLYQSFSRGLEQVTQQAAAEATALVFARHPSDNRLPMRPLVLGGDDLTVLIQAELAFAFSEAFLHAFHHHSKTMMQEIIALHPQQLAELPQALTACAGIVFMKPKQPFAQAHHIAEELCKAAKDYRGDKSIKPSALCFARMLDTHSDGSFSYLASNNQQQTLQLQRLRYTLDDAQMPFAALKALAQLSTRLNTNPLREIATLLGIDAETAKVRYRRFRSLAQQHQPQQLARFDELLAQLLGVTTAELSQLPVANVNGKWVSPLTDLETFCTYHPQGETADVA